MKRNFLALSVVAVAVLVGGCGGGGGGSTQVKAPENGPLRGEFVDSDGKPAPKWVTAPSTVHKDEEGHKVVCGEGSISGTANPSMAQRGSAARARAALTETLRVKVKSMINDYESTTSGGQQFKTGANDEQHVESGSKQVAEAALAGSEVTDTWISSQSTMHSLVCLNLEKFKEIASGMNQLDETIRKAVTQRAEKFWDKMDKASAQ